MTQATATQRSAEQASDKNVIRPFQCECSGNRTDRIEAGASSRRNGLNEKQ